MLVYKITNSVNDKLYIGVTVKTLQNRWNRHKSSANNGSNSPIHRAMRKYGFDAFSIELIMEVNSVEEMKKMEQMFIEEYNTFGPDGRGYNATKGGDGTWGRTHSQQTLEKIKDGLQKARDEGRFLNEAWYQKCLLARKNQIGVSFTEERKQKISKSLKGKSKNHLSGKLPVSVDQYCKETGEYIQTFESYGQAARAINSNQSDVMRCCQGKRRSVKGFIFKFSNIECGLK